VRAAEAPRLTQQVACAGCAAKIPIQVLEHVLGALPKPPRSPRLLVGPETWDDAGVYRISPTLAVSRRGRMPRPPERVCGLSRKPNSVQKYATRSLSVNRCRAPA